MIMFNDILNRREFLKTIGLGTATFIVSDCIGATQRPTDKRARRPNILFAISDDQSWPHAGAYGCKFVNTPAFDKVAREGILFNYAYCPAPQCSPARAALLTGRNIWQLEEAGTHSSIFPSKFQVYPDLLEAAGYHIGFTGKPWHPGNDEHILRLSGRKRNPAGPEFNKRFLDSAPAEGIRYHKKFDDYAGNFEDFLSKRPEGAPFCFWYGAHQPHRRYEKGSGLRAGKKLEDVKVPSFLPDTKEVRSDLLDYALEIDWFDTHLGRMIQMLEKMGELDNTLIVVTGDNGMPFPRAKANLYEQGTHVPLAIRWGAEVKGGRVVDDFVSFIDLAPMFLEAAGLKPPEEMTGRSLINVLTSNKSGRVDLKRDRVFTGRERHSHSRPDNLGYPSRAIRTYEYLYIRNFKPDRWPAGDPEGYHDIDNSPTKTFLLENRDKRRIRKLFELAFAKRPAEELYAIKKDPGCLHNLVEDPAYAKAASTLRAELEQVLKEQKDPRILGYGDIFESYPRFGGMRKKFKGFKQRGEYNPEYRKKAEALMNKVK